METEYWTDIKDFEGLYQVSNLGRVKSLGNDKTRKEKILKPKINSNGYCAVDLCNRGIYIKYNVLVHRLVAQAFIPNPDNLPVINHKDECKTNNHISNLEWCTQKYNAHYSRIWEKTGRFSKPVLQFTKSGDFVAEYESASEAQRQTGIKQQNISSCCLKKPYFHSAGGYIWKYK